MAHVVLTSGSRWVRTTTARGTNSIPSRAAIASLGSTSIAGRSSFELVLLNRRVKDISALCAAVFILPARPIVRPSCRPRVSPPACLVVCLSCCLCSSLSARRVACPCSCPSFCRLLYLFGRRPWLPRIYRTCCRTLPSCITTELYPVLLSAYRRVCD